MWDSRPGCPKAGRTAALQELDIIESLFLRDVNHSLLRFSSISSAGAIGEPENLIVILSLPRKGLLYEDFLSLFRVLH
jgi:hypothetical protein